MTSQLLASNWGPQYIFWDLPILYQDNFFPLFFVCVSHSSQHFLGDWSGSALSIDTTRFHWPFVFIFFAFMFPMFCWFRLNDTG